MKRATYNSIGYFIAACALMTLPFVVNAQTGPVNYTVTLDNKANSHLVHIALSVSAGGAPSIDVAMPAWSPGAYSIHNAWRNVQEFSAGDEFEFHDDTGVLIVRDGPGGKNDPDNDVPEYVFRLEAIVATQLV